MITLFRSMKRSDQLLGLVVGWMNCYLYLNWTGVSIHWGGECRLLFSTYLIKVAPKVSVNTWRMSERQRLRQ